MILHLVDINPVLIEAWRSSFAGTEVDIIEGDILDVAFDTLVSPANSYGFMDGGIDRLYTEHFGLQVQRRLQQGITQRAEGYLPVGAAMLVETGHQRIPYMIAAPTMMMPQAVPASHCFFAMAAALQCAWRHRHIIKDVFCPGLATLTGRVDESSAAREMAAAYKKFQDQYPR